MKVRFQGIARSRGRERLRATIDPPIEGQNELWFEVREGEVELLESADPFAIALLPIAGSRGLSLEIDGPLSPSLLFHLDEASRCLEKTSGLLRTDRHCRAVALSSTQLVERTRPDPRAAVVTVSGGVDATYTLLRHRCLLPSPARLDVRRAVFVHGFDIPLADEDGFTEAARGVERITDLAATELVLLATNIKQLRPDWELSNGAAAAAVLTCVSHGLGTGLHASTAPYDHPVSAWGSAPYLDHLFSSASFEIIYDGAAASRVEKVQALVSAWPEVVPHLRFCWEGERHDGNCGHCRKCVLTMLLFSLCGSEHLTFFEPPTRKTIEATLRKRANKPHARLAVRHIVEEADRRGVRPFWYRAAKRRMQQDRLRSSLYPYVPEGARRMRRSLRRLSPAS